MRSLRGVILKNEPDFIAVRLAVDLGVRPDPRLERGDAVPRRTEKRFAHRRFGLRPPGPDPHAHPVHELVSPDPDNPALVDMDLRHAFHARAQLFERALGARFHAKVIAAFGHYGDRGDFFDDERDFLLRHAGQRKATDLIYRDIRNVPLVDFHDDAVS